MAVWKLSAIDPESEHWRRSTVQQPVTIRAETENRARDIACRAFDIAAARSRHGGTLFCPWGFADMTACERLDDPAVPDEGPDAVLDPAEHDSEWRP